MLQVNQRVDFSRFPRFYFSSGHICQNTSCLGLPNQFGMKILAWNSKGDFFLCVPIYLESDKRYIMSSFLLKTGYHSSFSSSSYSFQNKKWFWEPHDLYPSRRQPQERDDIEYLLGYLRFYSLRVTLNTCLITVASRTHTSAVYAGSQWVQPLGCFLPWSRMEGTHVFLGDWAVLLPVTLTLPSLKKILWSRILVPKVRAKSRKEEVGRAGRCWLLQGSDGSPVLPDQFWTWLWRAEPVQASRLVLNHIFREQIIFLLTKTFHWYGKGFL